MTSLFLVAYLTNAHRDDPDITFALAEQSANGDWFIDTQQILPYWTQPLDIEPPPIPEGWLEHVRLEADRMAAKQRDSRRPTGLQALLAAKPQAEPVALIARRGF